MIDSHETQPGRAAEGGAQEDRPLFRHGAVEFFLRGEDAASPSRVSPPWSWALFWTVWALLGAVASVLTFVQVDVVSVGHGVVALMEGKRQALALLPGVEPGEIRPHAEAQVSFPGRQRQTMVGQVIWIGQAGHAGEGVWVRVMLPEPGAGLSDGTGIQVCCTHGRERLGLWLFPALGGKAR